VQGLGLIDANDAGMGTFSPRWCLIRVRQRTFFLFISALLMAVAAGIVFEWSGARRDKERFPRVGFPVDIGGRSLNIYCSGEGAPTVILDTGGSSPGYQNLPLQALVSKETRACWFDRAGLGWSDPGPVTQTSAAIAQDLHALLHGAKIDPPYILLGQSFSGFNVRVFTGKYRSEVAGLVLLDSVQEDQRAYEPRSTLGIANRMPARVRGLLCRAAPVAAKVGLVRLFTSVAKPKRGIPPGFTEQQAATLHGLEAQPKSLIAASGCDAWERSADEARAAGKFGDLPIVVLTAGKPIPMGSPQADAEVKVFHEIWVHQLQRKLVALSTRGRQVVVEGSSHGIAEDKPAVVEAIRQVLVDARGN
jgi:pimeloyl-ACP methyl ester carboxylesterase